jgi:hypothetical protein
MDCLRSSLAPDALSPVWAAGRDFTETEWSA